MQTEKDSITYPFSLPKPGNGRFFNQQCLLHIVHYIQFSLYIQFLIGGFLGLAEVSLGAFSVIEILR